MPKDADISFGDFDFLDFAQEFLRRNAKYEADFVRLSNRREPRLESADLRRMAQSWGLEFRLSTGAITKSASRNLACL